jgi:Uma2 family endonuclease
MSSNNRRGNVPPFPVIHNGDHLTREEFRSICEKMPPDFSAELIDDTVYLHRKVGKLHNGKKLSQEEFHSIYEKMPADFRAELIDGTVFIREPLGIPHASNHADLTTLLGIYKLKTPGLQLCDSASVFLSSNDEVQPDLLLRILPKYGGSSKDTYTGYIAGAPELVIEVAHSSRAIDLFKKRKRYEKFGVQEYMVFCLAPAEIFWFEKDSPNYKSIQKENGVYKSKIFPGLWIDEAAMIRTDSDKWMAVLEEGLRSKEHEQFVKQQKSQKR